MAEKVENVLENILITGELAVAKLNKQQEVQDFEGYVNLIDSIREPKDYDWMSDIRLPEFISHMLTQSSIDAQYFATRDFVEVYVQDESDEALAAASAAKECINRTLNQKELYHFLKFIRAKYLNRLCGHVYALCKWKQKTAKRVVDYREVEVELDIDENGEPIVSDNQVPAVEIRREPIYDEVPIVDRFDYDILDPRNVFTDNSYVYSMQDKKYVWIRSERSYRELLAEQESMNYVNLDKVKELGAPEETETSKETYNSDRNQAGRHEKNPEDVDKPFDVYTRFGKFWAIVLERDEEGNPTVAIPGIDEEGEPLDKAEFIETIITYVVKDNSSVLIRFQPTPYIDTTGKPYRPIIRGLCYVHPVDDGGAGDGKYLRELQLALDDTFNISNDRVMLATLPTMITRKYKYDDEDDVYIEPGHTISTENPKEDINWLELSDNIQGAMLQISMLRNMMQQVDSTYPTTMGDVPGLASTTATAVVGAENRSNTRSAFKMLTFENTFLTDFYWMILQMTARFALPETGYKLMGEKVYDFDPSLDYYYKPVSQTIESEQSKAVKIQMWTQILSYVASLQHPDTVKIVNYILSKIFEYMGDEFVNFGNNLLNPAVPVETGGGQGGWPENAQGIPATNQSGVPQSPQEQLVRGT